MKDLTVKNQALQQDLKKLGLGFVRIDSATQVLTVLDKGQLSQVSGGAGTSPGGTRTTPAPTKR